MRNSCVTVVIIFNGKTQARSTIQLCENVISKSIYWVSSDWTSVNKVLLKTPVLFFGFYFSGFAFFCSFFLAKFFSLLKLNTIRLPLFIETYCIHSLIVTNWSAWMMLLCFLQRQATARVSRNWIKIVRCCVVSVVAVSVANFICSCCCCAFVTHRDGGNTSDGLVAWCLTELTANVLTELYVEWVRTEERV